ncbi:MAG: hypothetical protein LBQ97_09640 [Fusobacteriaceae bacterium]|jgi:hypothetical protein|nr:hypothetical protein [Fusobacteriaceae bacterium]
MRVVKAFCLHILFVCCAFTHTFSSSKEPDLFVVGRKYIYGRDHDYSYLWKSGHVESISEDAKNVWIRGITVYKKNVYLIGLKDGIETVWINGIPEKITEDTPDTGQLVDIFANESGVYVLKSALHKLYYYRNGKKTVVTDTGHGKMFHAQGIHVSEDDVFITAWLDPNMPKFSPATYKNAEYTVLLKNGDEFPLEEPGSAWIKSSGMLFLGDDSYLAGTNSRHTLRGRYIYTPVFWKNGKKSVLTSKFKSAKATALAVEDNTVYIAGSGYRDDHPKNPTALLWINGIEHVLSSGEAAAIKVIGGNIYIAGFQVDDNKYKIKFWKNGTELELPNMLTDFIPEYFFIN